MKTPELDIANFLSCYSPKHVKKGFRLWAAEYVVTKGRFKKELKEQGWYPIESKPENREYYYIDGQYWIQDEEVRRRLEEEAYKNYLKYLERRGVRIPSRMVKRAQAPKTDLSEISKTPLKCPKCNGFLYKQAICPGCKEGREGYKIRLICEEDADHEFLV